MDKFKKLNRLEMKNIKGGTPLCYCGDIVVCDCGDGPLCYFYEYVNCDEGENSGGVCGNPDICGRSGTLVSAYPLCYHEDCPLS